MVITDEIEKQIITQHRQKMAERAMVKEWTLKILKTAYEFTAWMKETGIEPTYSAFFDDFGYQAREGENRNIIYERVMNIVTSASEMASHDVERAMK